MNERCKVCMRFRRLRYAEVCNSCTARRTSKGGVVEGIGLLLRRVWAEYVTIVITTSFVPLEIYELVERASLAKAIALVVNIAIVAYLALRLRSTKHWPFA